MSRNEKQPLPVVVPGGENINEMVIHDLRERSAIGMAKFGTHLQANNGRDPVLDWYQEQQDALLYAGQVVVEWKQMQKRIAELEAENAELRAELAPHRQKAAELEQMASRCKTCDVAGYGCPSCAVFEYVS